MNYVSIAPQCKRSQQRKQRSQRRRLPLLTLDYTFTLKGGVRANILASHPNAPSQLDLHQKAMQEAQPLDVIRQQL